MGVEASSATLTRRAEASHHFRLRTPRRRSAYFKEKRLPVVVVRLFNTVGPRQTGRYGMVIPNFVKQALLGRSITVSAAATMNTSAPPTSCSSASRHACATSRAST